MPKIARRHLWTPRFFTIKLQIIKNFLEFVPGELSEESDEGVD